MTTLDPVRQDTRARPTPADEAPVTSEPFSVGDDLGEGDTSHRLRRALRILLAARRRDERGIRPDGT